MSLETSGVENNSSWVSANKRIFHDIYFHDKRQKKLPKLATKLAFLSRSSIRLSRASDFRRLRLKPEKLSMP